MFDFLTHFVRVLIFMDLKDKINNIRKKLNRGKVSIGSWIQIPHPDIANIICNYNYKSAYSAIKLITNLY